MECGISNGRKKIEAKLSPKKKKKKNSVINLFTEKTHYSLKGLIASTQGHWCLPWLDNAEPENNTLYSLTYMHTASNDNKKWKYYNGKMTNDKPVKQNSCIDC